MSHSWHRRLETLHGKRLFDVFQQMRTSLSGTKQRPTRVHTAVNVRRTGTWWTTVSTLWTRDGTLGCHDCVLRELVQLLNSGLTSSQTLYCDLTEFKNPNEVVDQLRPDIVAHSSGKYFALELTCPHELNLETSRQYKEAKYSDVKTIENLPITVFTIEVSSLGFVRSDGLKKFCKALNITNPTVRSIRRLGEMLLRCSYFIFCSRHKVWPDDPGPPVF